MAAFFALVGILAYSGCQHSYISRLYPFFSRLMSWSDVTETLLS
jgi:hypothetical protein